MSREANTVDGLTSSEREVLGATQRLIEERSYSPTLREIAEACGLCHQSVDNALRGLQSKGWVRRAPKVARSLMLLRTIRRKQTA